MGNKVRGLVREGSRPNTVVVTPRELYMFAQHTSAGEFVSYMRQIKNSLQYDGNLDIGTYE